MSGPRDGSPTGPERGQDAALLLRADDARKGRPTRDAEAGHLPPDLHAPTPEEQERMVEALLFASPEPLPTAKIAERLPRGCDPRAALARLQRRYEGRGVNLVRSGGAWAFRTAPDLRFLLSREVVETRKLSRAGIETLAIVAYHGPVTRTEIEEIRGVSVSKGTLDQLMELGWVRLGRRRGTPGRPVTYVTTDAFLDHFALESAADLPNLGDLRAAGFLGDATVQEDLPLPEPDRTSVTVSSRSHPRPPLRLSRLRDIGFALWDPIGLLPPGETWEGHPAAAEYDAYLARATSMLRDGASDDECARYLLDIEVGHMGLAGTAPPGSSERLAKVVSDLRRYAEELDGP